MGVLHIKDYVLLSALEPWQQLTPKLYWTRAKDHLSKLLVARSETSRTFFCRMIKQHMHCKLALLDLLVSAFHKHHHSLSMSFLSVTRLHWYDYHWPAKERKILNKWACIFFLFWSQIKTSGPTCNQKVMRRPNQAF